VAMLFACLFLYLEIRRFGGFGAVRGRVSSIDYDGFSIVPDQMAVNQGMQNAKC
jgi:hypothetical protein